MFLNYDSNTGKITESTSRNNGVVCADDSDFLDSVLSGDTCTVSDYDKKSLMDALADGEFLSKYATDEDTVENLYNNLSDLISAAK